MAAVVGKPPRALESGRAGEIEAKKRTAPARMAGIIQKEHYDG
jgi:hypothetical protein